MLQNTEMDGVLRWRRGRTVALALLLSTQGGAAGFGAPPLDRPHDPVLVATGPFAGLSTGRFRAFRVRGGTREAVPFQFDRRDDEGEIDVASGDEFELDGNDELVMLARDTGERAPQRAFADARSLFEIEVTDPRDGAKAWAYVAEYEGEPPPPSPVRYVEFDLEGAEARSELYRVRYLPERSQVAGLAVSPREGPPTEVIDRTELHIDPTFALLFTRWSPGFTEDDFRVRIDGVRSGPVRAIRRVRRSLDLGRFFPNVPSGTTDSFYYRSAIVTPSRLSIPWLAVQALVDFRFEGLSILGPGARESRYWDAHTREGLAFGDAGPESIERGGDHSWFVLGTPDAAVFHMLEIPEEWREWGIERGTVLRRGDGAAAGYSLLEMTRLKAGGRYDMRATLVVLPHAYRPGDEEAAVALIDAPLETHVRRLR